MPDDALIPHIPLWVGRAQDVKPNNGLTVGHVATWTGKAWGDLSWGDTVMTALYTDDNGCIHIGIPKENGE